MPWFAFDIEAYDSDTMHLSAAEDGMYMRLLRHYYRTRLPLPDNDRALAAISRVGADEWATAKDTIRNFFTLKSGVLHHKRCDMELAKEDIMARTRSGHAKKAAEKRWNKTNNIDATSIDEHCSDDAPILPNDATRPDKTRQDIDRSNPVTTIDDLFAIFWGAYPERVGKPVARKAFAMAAKKIPFDDLMAGLERYKRTKPLDRAWCHPSTWLNQERWADDPAPANGKGTRHAVNVPAAQLRAEMFNGALEWFATTAKRPADQCKKFLETLIGDFGEHRTHGALMDAKKYFAPDSGADLFAFIAAKANPRKAPQI